MTWILFLMAVAAGILLFVWNMQQGDVGCNIEDDDIRSEAWLARVERKKKDTETMKAYLTEFVQKKWVDAFTTEGDLNLPQRVI